MKKGIIFHKPESTTEINEEHLGNCFDHTSTQRRAVWWNSHNPITIVDLTGKTKKEVYDFALAHKEDTLIIAYQDRFPIINAAMPYIDLKGKKYFYYFHAGDIDISHTQENEDMKFYSTLIEPLSLHGKVSMVNYLAENERNGEFLIIHNIDKFKISRLGKGWKESEGCYFSNDFFQQKKWSYTQNHQTTHYPANTTSTKRVESAEDDDIIDLVGLKLRVVKPQLALYFKLPDHVKYYVVSSTNPRLQQLDFIESIAGSKTMSSAQIGVLNARKKESFNPLHIAVLRYDQIAWSKPENRNDEHIQTIKTKLRHEYVTTLTSQQRFYIVTQLAKAISENEEAVKRNKEAINELNDKDLITKSAFLDLDWERITA